MKKKFTIRTATMDDVDSLEALEQKGFDSDRFSRDQFIYLLTKARAVIFIGIHDKQVVGSAVILWRSNSTTGRLYDIVIDPAWQGRGWRGCDKMSLEVRKDNKRAITFYNHRGYQVIGVLPDYYDDGSAGYKMVKTLYADIPKKIQLPVPYYAQTLEFTCGPASLMMALKYLTPELRLTRMLELNLWKESTLIFTTAGIGGTGPFGMAMAAQQRGYATEVYIAKEQTPFFSSVRKPDRRAVIRLVHEDQRARAVAMGTRVIRRDFTFKDMSAALSLKRIPLVLISTYRLHGDRAPHYVVMTGYDQRNVYFHDSYEAFYDESKIKARDIRMPIEEFNRMRRFGKDLYKCAVIIGPPSERPGASANPSGQSNPTTDQDNPDGEKKVS